MKKLIFTLIFLLSLATSAYAEGYIVRLSDEPVMLLSDDDSSLERLPLSDDIMYTADSIEEIESHFDSDSIISIIPNCTIELFSAPNDAYYNYQWSLQTTNSVYAYEKGLRGKGVKIGIIDTGFNYGHEDLDTDKIAVRYNLFTESDDVTDEVGHGSFVTGLIAADINNSLGIAGIADEAQLCIYKIFNGTTTTVDKLLLAISYAIDDECDVINMSLGVSENDVTSAVIKEIKRWINKAAAKNIIIVAAVGNNGDSTLNYPAALDNTIGVGSVSQSLERSSFSNCNSSVFVVAPGEKMSSFGYASSGSYSIFKTANRGTSYSAPIVTAMAALAKQLNSDMTVDEFKELLSATSTDLGDEGYDTSYGYGLVNIEAFTDKLFERYVDSITLSDDGSLIYSIVQEDEVLMYTATYTDGVLVDVTESTLSEKGEIIVDYPDDCDCVKLFFWDGLNPVWDTISINTNDGE